MRGEYPEVGMGRLFREFLEGTVFCCRECGTHLSNEEQLMSSEFKGRNGSKAFLFHTAVNGRLGPCESKVLITGLHNIADVHCIMCDLTVGWKYLVAYEQSQKYKEGKYILEEMNIVEECETV